MMKRLGVLSTLALLTTANAIGADISPAAFGLATRGSNAYVTLGHSHNVEAGHRDKARCSPIGDRRVLAPIPIDVFAPPDIGQSVVNRVLREVEAIWGPTGISFDWHRITSRGAAHTAQLDVTFDERGQEVASHPTALGWIPFTADGPEPSIHLSQARAETMISGTGFSHAPILTHDDLLGRALGRALSHELGHYFLKSKAHTPSGLMRASWPSDQLLSLSRRDFGLTAEQREAAAEHVQFDERTKSTPETSIGALPPLDERTRTLRLREGR